MGPYRKRDLSDIYRSFIFLIFICTVFVFVFVLSVSGTPVTEKVAKIFHKGDPTELDGKDIEVIGKSVAFSEEISMKKGISEYHAPSIFFVIDNSGNMWEDKDECRRDSMGHRFTVTEKIITHMADNPKDYQGVEVGVAIFGNSLYYEEDDDPKVLDTLPNSSNGVTSMRNRGGYIPLLKLHKEYNTKNGAMKGSDILQHYLETKIIGPNSNGYRYRSPTAPQDEAYNANTNIDIGFRAAVHAMKSSTSVRENHYIVFISDGEAKWNEQKEQFILPSLVPLTGIKTPIQYNISFAFDTLNTRSVRSADRNLDINFNVIIDHNFTQLDSEFQAFYWERTLGFYDKNGRGIGVIEDKDIEFNP